MPILLSMPAAHLLAGWSQDHPDHRDAPALSEAADVRGAAAPATEATPPMSTTRRQPGWTMAKASPWCTGTGTSRSPAATSGTAGSTARPMTAARRRRSMIRTSVLALRHHLRTLAELSLARLTPSGHTTHIPGWSHAAGRLLASRRSRSGWLSPARLALTDGAGHCGTRSAVVAVRHWLSDGAQGAP